MERPNKLKEIHHCPFSVGAITIPNLPLARSPTTFEVRHTPIEISRSRERTMIGAICDDSFRKAKSVDLNRDFMPSIEISCAREIRIIRHSIENIFEPNEVHSTPHIFHQTLDYPLIKFN